MTSKVRIIHGGGNKALAVIDSNGTKVAVLENEGEEFSDNVFDGHTFCVEETGDFKDVAQAEEPA